MSHWPINWRGKPRDAHAKECVNNISRNWARYFPVGCFLTVIKSFPASDFVSWIPRNRIVIHLWPAQERLHMACMYGNKNPLQVYLAAENPFISPNHQISVSLNMSFKHVDVIFEKARSVACSNKCLKIPFTIYQKRDILLPRQDHNKAYGHKLMAFVLDWIATVHRSKYLSITHSMVIKVAWDNRFFFL